MYLKKRPAVWYLPGLDVFWALFAADSCDTVLVFCAIFDGACASLYCTTEYAKSQDVFECKSVRAAGRLAPLDTARFLSKAG